ncbi:MAG: YebC/PmpR family DNA-binding transcriptional regulator [Spirochaetes bacterium]|nr:YebC/PmpR family DNA-binding transcriptional regulator [Spirochaetota bacterium]
MSGHSKWHSIKHKKAAVDAKRGQKFTKIIREITTSARLGGGDADSNPRLRLAMLKAKSVNMPADNIDRAIKKGTGELEGVRYEENYYEGYGPGGTAILINSISDNKNRTTAEIRSILSKHGGNLGENGCVSWMFSKKGVILVNKQVIKEDDLFNIVVDAGCEDLKSEEKYYEITIEPENFEAMKKKLDENNIKYESAEITMVPQNYIEMKEEKLAKQMAKLLMVLEEHDDVQNVYTNADIPDEAFEGL